MSSNYTIEVQTTELEEALTDGYGYLDNDGNAVDEMPVRGWYVSYDDSGKPVGLRLTDDPTDKHAERARYHFRTDGPFGDAHGD